jgi:TonB family protein
MLTLVGLLMITGQGQNRCCFSSHPIPGECDEVQVDTKTLMKNRVSCVDPIITEDDYYRGPVIVSIIVNTNGDVTCAIIYRGVPDGIQKTVLQAVRKWKFKPFMIKGKPVAVTSLTAVVITGNQPKNCAIVKGQ